MAIISWANSTRASLSSGESKCGYNSLMRIRFEIDSCASLLHIVNLRILSRSLIYAAVDSLRFKRGELELFDNWLA